MPLNENEKTQEMEIVGSNPETSFEQETESKAVNFAEIVQDSELEEPKAPVSEEDTGSLETLSQKNDSDGRTDSSIKEHSDGRMIGRTDGKSDGAKEAEVAKEGDDGDLQAQIDLLKQMIAEQKAAENENYANIRTDVARNAINTNQTGRRAKKALIIAVIVAVVCALIVAALTFGKGLIFPEQQNNNEQATEQTTEDRHDVISLTGGDHDHDWETNMVTVEAPLLTKNIEHAAEYEDKQVLHTVCNTCHKTIDGSTAEHTKETGHASFTTNVPVVEKVKVKDAWTETVTVQEYQSKTVQNGEKCRICGQLRNEKSMDELMAQLGFKSSVDE